MDFETNDIVPNDWTPENSIIKVIGVGGGGCNAVNYMYNQHIEGCTFIVCNTDAQALNSCDVPIKIKLGEEGLGAGCNPTEGRNAALNSQDEIAEKVINSNTDMLFITAGMGGGTGTGAAPVIAAMAKKKGILTVGVVTIPFKSEGNESMSKAIDGIKETTAATSIGLILAAKEDVLDCEIIEEENDNEYYEEPAAPVVEAVVETPVETVVPEAPAAPRSQPRDGEIFADDEIEKVAPPKKTKKKSFINVFWAGVKKVQEETGSLLDDISREEV